MKDCVSFEVARQLEKAGFKDPEHFYWQHDKKLGPVLCTFDTGKPEPHNVWGGECTPAPTIGELAHALPMDIHIDKLTRDGKECYRVTLTQDEKMDYDTIEDTLADTLGACLVSLMKDGYKPPNS